MTTQSASDNEFHQLELNLHPNEASGLLTVENDALLESHGWEFALWAVLDEGEIEGCTLECWLHGSRFDLRTGEPTGLPAIEPVPVYPVEVRDGDVYVSLNPTNGVEQ